MGQDLSSMGLMHCTTVLGNAQFIHTFIKCMNFQKELVIGFDIQQLHHLGCDLMENDHMFLYGGVDILVTSINIATKEQQLCIISNYKVPTNSILMIATRKSGISISNTSCVYDNQVNRI